MGSIDIIKALSTVLSSAVSKSQQHQEKKSRERRESNPGAAGCKARMLTIVVFARTPLYHWLRSLTLTRSRYYKKYQRN